MGKKPMTVAEMARMGGRAGEGPQQGPASGLGQAGRKAGDPGQEGACPPTKAPECWQEPSSLCHCFGGFGPHHRAGRGANEGVTDVY